MAGQGSPLKVEPGLQFVYNYLVPLRLKGGGGEAPDTT